MGHREALGEGEVQGEALGVALAEGLALSLPDPARESEALRLALALAVREPPPPAAPPAGLPEGERVGESVEVEVGHCEGDRVPLRELVELPLKEALPVGVREPGEALRRAEAQNVAEPVVVAERDCKPDAVTLEVELGEECEVAVASTDRVAAATVGVERCV